MKKLIIIIALIIWGTIGASKSVAHVQVVSGYFYNGLTPYGSWIELDYGVVVWRPTVMRVDWAPYCDGRWIWTTDGWYWDSYEPFGYITYHYGRWYFDDYYGWLWYPDYEWAPLHPYAIFSISIGIHFTTTYYTPYYHWNFVKYHYFYDPHVYNYCLGPKYKYRVYSNTRYRTNYGYQNGRVRNNGVDVEIVRKRTSADIRQINIERVSDPVVMNNRTNSDGRVRTVYKSREELVRNEVTDVTFEKSNRKSSLDVTKVRRDGFVKRENTTPLNNNRNSDLNTREMRNNTITKQNRTNTSTDRSVQRFDERNKSSNNINRNNNNQVRTQTNNNRQEIKINKNNTQQKREIKVNRNTQQNREVKVNRNNTQQKRQIKVNRNTGNNQNRKRTR